MNDNLCVCNSVEVKYNTAVPAGQRTILFIKQKIYRNKNIISGKNNCLFS